MSRQLLKPLTDSDIAADGYMSLPGGLILQWGSVTLSTPAGQTVAFPLQFPNACLGVYTSDRAAADTSIDAISVDTFTTTGFDARYVRIDATTTTTQCYFLAIGH